MTGHPAGHGASAVVGPTLATLGPVDVAGTPVGLERPAVLLCLPVVVAVLYALVLRGEGGSDGPDGDSGGEERSGGGSRPYSGAGTGSGSGDRRRRHGGRDPGTSEGPGRREPGDGGTSRRGRRALFVSRLVVVACLVVAAAAPYAVATRERTGDPSVTMLVDRSASTGVSPSVAGSLEAGIEDRGVDVTRSVVASGNRSRVGDGLVANLRANGSVLLVSDGRVTGGRTLAEAAEVARRLNATVNVITPGPNRTERAVSIAGPATASAGVENRFLVTVDGVSPDDDSTAPPAELVVSVDGEVVDRTTVSDARGRLEFEYTFETNGSHRVTARLAGDDRYAVNDVARTTVEVVPRPRVLYVSQGDYRLREYLSGLYRVETARRVPDDLDRHAVVVVQNVPADAAGNLSALSRYVIEGGGLVVAGGPDAFAAGNYSVSRLGAMVPVRSGDSDGRRSRIVLAVDVSGSAEAGMDTQKALALDVLDQLGDRNRVGLVAFDEQAYRVADLRPLSAGRADLESKVRRLRAGGGTSVATGLTGAARLLDGPGTVVLVSDGQAPQSAALSAADRLAERDVRVISVGVGTVDPAVLSGVADRTGGTYLRANETERLRIRFGGPDRRFDGGSLTVLDRNHFVTAGVRTGARMPFSNSVSVKPGADLLVATGDGDPAVSTWRYGVGRVVAVTAYGPNGGLGGLLSAPDSLLVSKSVNWAVGDPRRAGRPSLVVPDTRVGRETVAVYRGPDPPSAAGLPDAGGDAAGTDGGRDAVGASAPRFVSVGDDRYEATFTPGRRGYDTFSGTTFAVNYRREYAAFGPSPSVAELVEATGGRRFEPDEVDAVVGAVTEQTRRTTRTRVGYDWPFLTLALVVFLGEVYARRLLRRRTDRDGGVVP